MHDTRIALSPLGVQIDVIAFSADYMLCAEFLAFSADHIQFAEFLAFDHASRGLLAEALARLERWKEFDTLVSLSSVARDHILSLPSRTPLGDVAHAQHRVRTVVATDAARRALAEIQGEKA